MNSLLHRWHLRQLALMKPRGRASGGCFTLRYVGHLHKRCPCHPALLASWWVLTLPDKLVHCKQGSPCFLALRKLLLICYCWVLLTSKG